MTLPARLGEASQADLERLIATGAQEGSQLDFKRDYPKRWDNETKFKVLADVTAFANAGGGDVVYGMDQDKEARAAKIVPQHLENADQEALRLMDVASTQAEPRIPGIEVQPVPVTVGDSKGYVIVMRIPQSWAAPHRNRINQHFHVREGAHNRLLEIPEIRSQFLRSEALSQRLRDFRNERLAKIVSGQTPVKLTATPKLVVHALPTQAAVGQVNIDPTIYSRNIRRLPILGKLPAASVSLNFDGAFAPISSGLPTPPGYTQQFRQGYFEAVWELPKLGNDPRTLLLGAAFEDYINGFLDAVRRQLDAESLSLEIAVFLSLVNAKDAFLAGPSGMGVGYVTRPFDRKDILLPEAIVPADVKPSRGMRGAYDVMWQSAGYECSPNYDDAGEWRAAQ